MPENKTREILEIIDILVILGAVGALIFGYNFVAIALLLASIRIAVGRPNGPDLEAESTEQDRPST